MNSQGSRTSHRPPRSWHLSGLLLVAGLALTLAGPVLAQPIVFDTELISMTLTGGPFPMPLASDPGNLLGDSIDGYGFVNSQVTITLSSQRPPTAPIPGPGPQSPGWSVAYEWGTRPPQPPFPPLPPINPTQLDGQSFQVDSFFDVFFDITVTDVDGRAGRDFAGMQDGAMVMLPNNGPARMFSQYAAVFDALAVQFGLIPPPEESPFIGAFDIQIPLGGDINGNGENDKVKFTFAINQVLGENRITTTLPDGTVLHEFDTAAVLEGAVVDESQDPPFTIGSYLSPGNPDPASFGGPTVARSQLLNDVVPEPASLALLGLGLAALARRRRKLR